MEWFLKEVENNKHLIKEFGNKKADLGLVLNLLTTIENFRREIDCEWNYEKIRNIILENYKKKNGSDDEKSI